MTLDDLIYYYKEDVKLYLLAAKKAKLNKDKTKEMKYLSKLIITQKCINGLVGDDL